MNPVPHYCSWQILVWSRWMRDFSRIKYELRIFFNLAESKRLFNLKEIKAFLNALLPNLLIINLLIIFPIVINSQKIIVIIIRCWCVNLKFCKKIRMENQALKENEDDFWRLKLCSGLLATNSSIVTNYPLAENCCILI